MRSAPKTHCATGTCVRSTFRSASSRQVVDLLETFGADRVNSRGKYDHPLLASATLDRLRHNAYCIELDGPSYRDPKVAPASKKSVPKSVEKGPSKGSENTAK